MAAGAIPLAIGQASRLVSALLAKHTQRLQDATSENQALDNLIPAFDADLQAVVQAFNSGTSPSDCITALYAIDSNAYSYLRAQVGRPGTAWGGPSTGAIGMGINPTYSATCNKKCTAGCCVYLNDLRPVIFGRSGVNIGLVETIQKGGGSVSVPAIAAPPRTAYGDYSRAAYSLNLKAPVGLSVNSAVLQSSGSGANFAITPTQGGILSSVTNNTSLAILGGIGAVILILTALFGQNALRVK